MSVGLVRVCASLQAWQTFQGHLLVQAHLNGREAGWMLLDTGVCVRGGGNAGYMCVCGGGGHNTGHRCFFGGGDTGYMCVKGVGAMPTAGQKRLTRGDHLLTSRGREDKTATRHQSQFNILNPLAVLSRCRGAHAVLLTLPTHQPGLKQQS
jgi:hypothetical protein